MASLRELPAALESATEALFARADYWLSCTECGKVQKLTAKEYMNYFPDGFPVCCGYTMLLESERKKS